MQLRMWLLLAALIGPLSIQALLPPLYLTLAEFKAIIEDKKLLDKLSSGEAIVSIARGENNTYEILTTQHKIIVDVVFEKTQMIGPGKFHLEFHDPQPL